MFFSASCEKFHFDLSLSALFGGMDLRYLDLNYLNSKSIADSLDDSLGSLFDCVKKLVSDKDYGSVRVLNSHGFLTYSSKEKLAVDDRDFRTMSSRGFYYDVNDWIRIHENNYDCLVLIVCNPFNTKLVSECCDLYYPNGIITLEKILTDPLCMNYYSGLKN